MGNRHHPLWTTRCRHRGADIAHGAWTSRTSHFTYLAPCATSTGDARRGVARCAASTQGARQVREVRGEHARCAANTGGARQVRKVRGKYGGCAVRGSPVCCYPAAPQAGFSQPDMSGVQFGNDRQRRERGVGCAGGVDGVVRTTATGAGTGAGHRRVTAAASAPTDLVPTAQTVHGLCEPRPGCVSRGRGVRAGWEPALSPGGGLLAHRRRGGPALRGRRAHCGTAPANRRRPAPRGVPGPVRRSPTSRSS